MSILYGFYEADAGEIRIAGAPRRIRSPADAIAAGIGMVHQHFMLVETLSVVENVVLGAEGGLSSKAALARPGPRSQNSRRITASRSIPMPSSAISRSACSSASKS